MTEVCRFFGARSGMVALLDPRPRGGDPLVRYGVAGGFLDESTIRLYQRYSDEAHLRDLMLTQIMARSDPAGVSTRRNEVPDQTWYNSVHFNEMRIPLGIDDPIYAFWRAPSASLVAGIGFNRELRARQFDSREQRLARVLHDALVPFYRYLLRAKVGTTHPRLSPRAREVYQWLCRGLSEKEIAKQLEISRHTVHDHVKRIYVVFGVNSRAELMARVATSWNGEQSGV